MHIRSIKVKNFRCFGPEGATVYLDNITALIGANGCGKTAVLLALLKIFGLNRGQAQLEKSDFHIALGNENADSRTLEIEARIEFPGLEEDDFGDPDPSIPAFVNQVLIDDAEDEPHCILRLNATWTRVDSPEGDIESELNWIISPVGTPIDEERKCPATQGLRPRVSLIYVPANRDPSQQVRQTTGSVLHRLFRSIRWSGRFQEELKEVANKIDESFAEERSVKEIRTIINEIWALLHGDKLYGEVDFQPISPEISDFLRGVSMVFFPNEENQSTDVSFLSDGMRSLFYLTLIMSMSEIDNKSLEERKAAWLSEENSNEQDQEDNLGVQHTDDIENDQPLLGDIIDLKKLSSPLLTILAIEEPECQAPGKRSTLRVRNSS